MLEQQLTKIRKNEIRKVKCLTSLKSIDTSYANPIGNNKNASKNPNIQKSVENRPFLSDNT